jgi:hypothetical protein
VVKASSFQIPSKISNRKYKNIKIIPSSSKGISKIISCSKKENLISELTCLWLPLVASKNSIGIPRAILEPPQKCIP